MTSHWTHQLARALAAGRLTPTLESHLDALLLWLSNPDNPHATEVGSALRRAGLSQRQAATRAYALLDRWLFADPDQPSPRTLGLPADADPTLAKQRYRRLIQVYHPDRHPTQVAWATHRTERINLAFDAHRRGANGWTNRSVAAAPTAGAHSPRDSVAPAWIAPTLWSWLIQSLEMAKGARGRLLAGAALTCLLTIGVAFFSHAPRPVPAPRVIRPSVETLSQPTPRSEPRTGAAETPEANSAIAVANQPDQAPDTPAETVSSDIEPAPPQAEPRLESEASSRMTVRSERADGLEPRPESRPQPDVQISETALTLAIETPSPIVATPEPATPPSAERAPPIVREHAVTQASEPPSASTQTSAGPVEEPPDHARESPRPILPDRLPDPAIPRMTAKPQMTIPSVAPPSAPASPTPPNPPALAGLAAPLAPAIAPNAEAAAVNCGTVPELLANFQRAYEAGALNELMALYSPESRENDLVNWLSIRHTYADWFSKTSARRIVFEQLNVQPTANPSRCAAIAIFQVSYLDAQGHLATQANVIEFLFERRGADLYILRVRY